MKKIKLSIILLIFSMLFIRAACDKEDNEKPPFYFKCFLNGAYREYTINMAYYSDNKDITTINGSSELYGELEMVWKGQKISSGKIQINSDNNSDKMQYIWLRENMEQIDSFKTESFEYQIIKYENPGGKISGEFSALIKCDSIARPETLIIKPATDTTAAITIDTVFYDKVPEFQLEISKGEFSILRSNDI